MTISKYQKLALWVGSIKNEIILIFFYKVNKYEILLLSTKFSIKTFKISNKTPIKLLFVDFTTILQIYACAYFTSTALKGM